MLRFLKITLALLWLVFTAWIVPSHTRGYITWGKGDSCCGKSSAPSCHVASDGQQDDIPFSKQTDAQKADSRKRCAVCFTVALFDVPPAFVLWDDYQGLLERQNSVAPQTPAYRFIPLTYQSRAPPVLPA